MQVTLNNKHKGQLLYPIEEGRHVYIMDGKDSVKLPIVREINLWNKLGFALEFVTLDGETHKIEYGQIN